MPERIYKLQPNRTMALRGFDHLGASAAMHSATADGFELSGNFRDAADFCVLTLWDVDNFFEYPTLKYLPDPSFAGLTLTFDVTYTGLQPLDSQKFPTIDWPYLDVINMDGTGAQVKLFDHATQAGGTLAAASATFTVMGDGLQPYDRMTLWYQNFAFDYIVPDPATDVSAATVASALAVAINGATYPPGEGLTATSSGNSLVVTAALAGRDGNMIRLHETNRSDTLQLSPAAANLSGGVSEAVWRVTLDFSALGLTSIRKMWMTFAPALANGAPYAGGDWNASFNNWQVSGPEDTKKLQVAGPGSVRVNQSGAGCTYSGTWNQRQDFYDGGFANRATGLGTTARVKYSCAATHDVYIGTLLKSDAGVAGVQLDGDAETDLNCALGNSDIVITRRKVRSGVAAGSHELTLVLKLGQYFDFNFLEAAAPSDIPAALPARANLSPALDFDTDHTYKLPPARILWMFDQLGFAGPINEYLGVFWWNQRINTGGVVPSLTLGFEGTWAEGDSIFLDIGAPRAGALNTIDRTQTVSTISKSVFAADTPETIAEHFADFINGGFSGIWAEAAGAELTIHARSAWYGFAVEVSPQTATAAGSITHTGSLAGGVAGEWDVDTTQTPVINTGAAAWHADFYRLCQARGTDVASAISMELVNPPADYPARFQDGSAVTTDTGFGTYKSSHCALGGPVLAFQQTVLLQLAALQTAAGLRPYLQMGEFLWWFFGAENNGNRSMAYYDDGTKAAARSALGRELGTFLLPTDDPTVNGGADALFLRNRLRDHVAALTAGVRAVYPLARMEVLLPLDVNNPSPVGPVGAQVGGRLNRFVNIPEEWLAATTAGFDLLKIEALAFGSTLRNLDLAREAIDFPLTLAWPRSQCRYLAPVFGTASPWQKEVRFAMEAGYPVVNLWAFDHICLYGWKITSDAFTGAARASFQG